MLSWIRKEELLTAEHLRKELAYQIALRLQKHAAGDLQDLYLKCFVTLFGTDVVQFGYKGNVFNFDITRKDLALPLVEFTERYIKPAIERIVGLPDKEIEKHASSGFSGFDEDLLKARMNAKATGHLDPANSPNHLFDATFPKSDPALNIPSANEMEKNEALKEEAFKASENDGWKTLCEILSDEKNRKAFENNPAMPKVPAELMAKINIERAPNGFIIKQIDPVNTGNVSFSLESKTLAVFTNIEDVCEFLKTISWK